AIEHDLVGLSNVASDWANWDDTYQFVADRNARFIEMNLIPETFSNLRINALGFFSREELVWGEIRDPQTLKTLEIRDYWPSARAAVTPIIEGDDADATRTGLLLTSRGAMLIAARPVLTSKREKPIRGAV